MDENSFPGDGSTPLEQCVVSRRVRDTEGCRLCKADPFWQRHHLASLALDLLGVTSGKVETKSGPDKDPITD